MGHDMKVPLKDGPFLCRDVVGGLCMNTSSCSKRHIVHDLQWVRRHNIQESAVSIHTRETFQCSLHSRGGQRCFVGAGVQHIASGGISQHAASYKSFRVLGCCVMTSSHLLGPVASCGG